MHYCSPLPYLVFNRRQLEFIPHLNQFKIPLLHIMRNCLEIFEEHLWINELLNTFCRSGLI
jgi:hypothetical protein